MIDIKTNQPGQVKLADEALAVIAGTAAMETEGVLGLSGHLAGDITGKISRRNLSKGISVTQAADGDAVRISADIVVKANMKVQDVCHEAQQKIKNAVETMTGLSVSEVNITVNAAAADKPR